MAVGEVKGFVKSGDRGLRAGSWITAGRSGGLVASFVRRRLRLAVELLRSLLRFADDLVVAVVEETDGPFCGCDGHCQLLLLLLLLSNPLYAGRLSCNASTVMSLNVMCAPSMNCPGYLSKKSSIWKTGENRMGLVAKDFTS